METFYDGLIFDDRSIGHLFDKNHSRQPFYADVLKRWAVGNRFSKDEQKILTSILVYYPEYVLQNGKTEDSIRLINNLLQRTELQKAFNPERGLWLYTLLYFLILTGAKEKWLPVCIELKNVFSQYETFGYTILDGLNSDSLVELLSSKTFGNASSKEKIAKAYLEIVSGILDLKEILLFEPYFNLTEFPLPRVKLNEYDLQQLRHSALELYRNKSYTGAFSIYKIMRIARFELSGTLIHMVRLQLSLGNIAQSEFYTAMAWRNRESAVDYVLARILFMIVFVNMLQSKPFSIWLACLKHALIPKQNNFFPVEWEMEEVVDQYEIQLKPKQTILLRRILALLSHGGNSKKLNNLSQWKNLSPLAKEKWPDYSIMVSME